MAMGSRQRPPPASRRVRAPFYATPLPAPAPQAARPTACAGLCGARTHSGLPCARGRGDEAASTAATARVRRFSASRHPLAMPTHTALAAAHGPHPAPHTQPPELLHLLPAARHRRSRPHPSARVIPLGSARCSLVCVRARPVRGGTGTRVAAVQQELHTERQPAPAAVHRKNPARRFPRRRPEPCALTHRCDALTTNGSGEFDFRPN